MLANTVFKKEGYMPRDKTANHIKIMAAAKDEFMDFGFEKSSMRGISKRCYAHASRAIIHTGKREFPILGNPLQ